MVKVTELPVELYSLVDLEVLRLEYNQLTNISNDLCNLSKYGVVIVEIKMNVKIGLHYTDNSIKNAFTIVLHSILC